MESGGRDDRQHNCIGFVEISEIFSTYGLLFKRKHLTEFNIVSTIPRHFERGKIYHTLFMFQASLCVWLAIQRFMGDAPQAPADAQRVSYHKPSPLVHLSTQYLPKLLKQILPSGGIFDFQGKYI